MSETNHDRGSDDRVSDRGGSARIAGGVSSAGGASSSGVFTFGAGSSGTYPMNVRTRLAVALRVAPVGDIRGNLATLLADSLPALLAMFYPPAISKKANVAVTELLQNVLENIVDPDSELQLDLRVDPDALVIEVRNKATAAQCAAVRGRIDALREAADPRRLLAETLRARRAGGLKGGLGLLRLVSENRFRLTVRDEDEHLTVQAEFPLRGTA